MAGEAIRFVARSAGYKIGSELLAAHGAAAEIHHINNPGEDYAPEMYKAILRRNLENGTWRAIDAIDTANELVGLVVYNVSVKYPGISQIQMHWVNHAMGETGIGSKLLQQATDDLKGWGASEARACIGMFNQAAQNLYQWAGW